jgi:hypothetical protein
VGFRSDAIKDLLVKSGARLLHPKTGDEALRHHQGLVLLAARRAMI